MTLGSEQKTVYVLYGLAFLATLGYGIMIPSLAVHAHSTGATHSAIGVMVSAFAAAQLLTQIPMGRLSDRMGRVYFVVAGFGIMATAATLYNFASGSAQFTLLQVVAGVGSGCLWPPLMAMLTDNSPAEQRGRMMGIFNTVFFLGIGLGPLLGGFLASSYGPIAVFNAWAGVALIGGLLCALVLKDAVGQRRAAAARTAIRVPDEPLIRRGFMVTFVAGCLVRSRGGVCTSFNNALLPLYAVAMFDATPAMIGSLMFIHGLGLAFLNIPGGIFSDRWGRRAPAVIGSFVATAGVLWYAAAGGYWALFAAVALAGAGAAFSGPGLGALAADVSNPKRRGEAFGYMLTSFNVGMVLGAIVFGFVAELVGLWGAVVAWGLTSLVLSMFSFGIREPVRQPVDGLAAQAR